MDTTETALLVGLGALGLGAFIGWHMRLSARRTRAAGAAPTAGAPPVGKMIEPPGQTRYTKPITSSEPSPGVASSAPCGCS